MNIEENYQGIAGLWYIENYFLMNLKNLKIIF